MKAIVRGWIAGVFLSASTVPQCFAQSSPPSSRISDLEGLLGSFERSLDWSAVSSHQSILSKQLLLSQREGLWASSSRAIAPLSAVAPFSVIAASLERADPDSEAIPTPERAEFLAALRIHYPVESPVDQLCSRGPSATGGDQAWHELLRAIEAKSRPADAQTLGMAIEALHALHADPVVRRRALAAAEKLLDCPQGHGDVAELQMIALGASAFEIDHDELQEATRAVLLGSQPFDQAVFAPWAEQGSTPSTTFDALVLALHEPGPLPAERDLYPVNKRPGDDAPDSSPRLCLALSGGGIRSAAFQIGVLQGLRDRGLLDRVDLISAVSGGGYAMSWFIASRLEEAGAANPRPLFESGFLREDYCRGVEVGDPRWPDCAPPPPPYAFLDEDKVATKDSGFAQLVSKPESLFLFLVGLLAVPIEAAYDSLETDLPSFLLEHRNYVRLLHDVYSIPDYTLAELARRLAQVSDLAYPIFSATARAGDCTKESSPTIGLAADFKTSSFELAPSEVGSTTWGFSSAAPYLYTVADAAAISGAALDVPSGLACSAIEKARLRLGTRLRGPERELRHVTDGGYSDNLALAPLLLRRNCQAIIVADAGQDPHLAFSSYQRLVKALEHQNVGTLKVEGIDELVKMTSPRCETRDSPPCFVTHVVDEDAPQRSRRLERGWFTGTAQTGTSDGDGIPLLYLKMAVDERMLDCYPEAVAKAIDWNCSRPHCKFPDIPTHNQWLSEVHFRGLRHLGRYLVNQAVREGKWSPAVGKTGAATEPGQ